MASESSHGKRHSKKRARVESEKKIERLNSLPWNSSLPEIDNGSDDAFSFFIGSNELAGGFLELEEIDESEYGLEIPKIDLKNKKKQPGDKMMANKRKINERNGNEKSGSDADSVNDLEEEGKRKDDERQGKQKKKKKKVKKDDEETNEANRTVEKTAVRDGVDRNEEDSTDEAEYHLWNELRLHPLIMKSIYRLRFKEPTPIQKACIPVAAHQGKDVIGAAETGSGKTLAFGLPILQRLLEEQEKVERLLDEKGKASERIAPQSVLRALVVTPTRELALQVTDHLREVAKGTNFRVVPIVGGMSTEKQERILKSRPEIVVGTPGRLWELMSGGEIHLMELHSLSFFVLDEADRMIEAGHFRELQSIIDMLPMSRELVESKSQNSHSCVTFSNLQKKKRQTLVFSATLALSADFRKKLKRGSVISKKDGLNSMETLSERAGMRENTAIVDLTNASILAKKLTESVIECREEEKDAYLYYILSIHGQGRSIVFCSSISALRRIASLLRILDINVLTLHSEMQQRARLKAVDRFCANEHSVLVATDAAARGLDVPGVRTVIHYQLPLSAEVYVHRCGRTARAFSDGCSIMLMSPNDASKFAALCKSFAKESYMRFPVAASYMPEIMKRLSLASQIDRITGKDSQERAEKNWFDRNAETVGLILEDNSSEDERVMKYRQKKITSNQLKRLQQELNTLLSRPLQPKTFSKRFLAGAGISPLLQHQFEELGRQKVGNASNFEKRKSSLVVIGQDCVEPLQALRNSSNEACLDLNKIEVKQKNLDSLKKRKKDMKKHMHEQRRKQRKKLRSAN